MTGLRFLPINPSRPFRRSWWQWLPLLLLPACVAAPEAPPNAPQLAAPLLAEPSLISLPVRIDLAQAAAALLRAAPRPFLRGSQRRLVPVRHSSMSTSVASEPGVCSLTALSCLSRHSVHTVAADSLATAEAEVIQQMRLRGIALEMEGNRLQWTAQLDVEVAARLPADAVPLGATACGGAGAHPRLELQQSGYVAWGAGGEVVLSPGPHALRWLHPCALAGLPGGAGVLLDLPALRDRLQDMVERQVLDRLRQDRLQARLAQAWPALSAPRELSAGVWLLPRPERLAFGDLAGHGHVLATTLLLQARPEVVRGARPDLPVPPLPLPAPVQSLAGSDGLRVAVRGDLALAEAERQLRHNLADGLRLVNGAPVRLGRVRVWGNGDHAVLGLAFAQPALAELHVLARPEYDPLRNEVYFRELAFTPATRAYLARTARWMLVPGLLSALQAQARFHFDDGLAGALADFRDLRLAAGDDLTLHGDLQRVQPRALYFTRDHLVALLLLEGRLALEARQE